MKKVILLLISIVTVFAVNLFAAKNLYLSILKEPTSVHKNQKFEVKVRGKVIDLTLREFEVLKYLANQPGQVVTRETLLEKVWGYEYYGDIRTVDVTVRRIREKIEKDTSAPKILITKRGVGYYLATN